MLRTHKTLLSPLSSHFCVFQLIVLVLQLTTALLWTFTHVTSFPLKPRWTCPASNRQSRRLLLILSRGAQEIVCRRVKATTSSAPPRNPEFKVQFTVSANSRVWMRAYSLQIGNKQQGLLILFTEKRWGWRLTTWSLPTLMHHNMRPHTPPRSLFTSSHAVTTLRERERRSWSCLFAYLSNYLWIW